MTKRPPVPSRNREDPSREAARPRDGRVLGSRRLRRLAGCDWPIRGCTQHKLVPMPTVPLAPHESDALPTQRGSCHPADFA